MRDSSRSRRRARARSRSILPDTTSSTRYTEFDAPYLKEALKDAGLSRRSIIIQNAQGSDSTFITDAQADITAGAKVIGIDPEDSATGAKVESYAPRARRQGRSTTTA